MAKKNWTNNLKILTIKKQETCLKKNLRKRLRRNLKRPLNSNSFPSFLFSYEYLITSF